MYGTLNAPEMPIYGLKTLAVRDGTLDLHGNLIMCYPMYILCDKEIWS